MTTLNNCVKKTMLEPMVSFFKNILSDKKAFWVIISVNILAFAPFLFNEIFTNHTLPNVWSIDYPTYRTLQEHRFSQDFFYFLFGGGGGGFLTLFLSLIIQIVNGFLAAKLFDYTQSFQKIVFCIFVSLHPYIWDYYGFAADSIGFVLGDTLIILALVLSKRACGLYYIFGVLSITLSFGFYPPKISLLLTLGVFVLIRQLFLTLHKDEVSIRKFFYDAGYVLLVILGGCLLYYISLTIAQKFYLGVTDHNSSRLHIASFMEMCSMMSQIYKDSWLFWLGIENREVLVFPAILSICSFVVSLGAIFWGAIIIFKKNRYRGLNLFFFFLLILSLPITLNIASIINPFSYVAGRFYFQWAYVWPFFIAFAYNKNFFIDCFLKIYVFLIACFFVLLSNEIFKISYFRNIREWSFLTRIAARVEPELQSGKNYKLIMIGEGIKTDEYAQYRKYLTPHLQQTLNIVKPMLASYRRVEYLNTIMVGCYFEHPSVKDVADSIDDIHKMPVWPQEGSIKVKGEYLIIRCALDDAIYTQ